jgi:hypothetical protein
VFLTTYVSAGQDQPGFIVCHHRHKVREEEVDCHSQLPWGVVRDRDNDRGVFGVPDSSKTSSSNDLANPLGLTAIGSD